MDALAYRKAVRRTLGLGETDTAALPDAVALAAINDALKTIAAEAEWSWLYATATGVLTVDNNTVAAPAGYVRTISFTVGEYGLTERPLYAITGITDEAADPVFFARAGDNLQLWPTPAYDDAYTHHYYSTETALVDDTDEPLIPDAYSPWVVAQAALVVPFRTNSPAKYEILREEVADWRRRAYADLRRERNAAPHGIKRTRTSIWQQV